MSYLDRDRYGMYKSSSSAGPGPRLMGADTLIGDNVVNGQEDDLGDIKEIMIDMRGGQVAYAVLSFGGFLGLGEKLFAVPWQALQLDTINKRFVLNVSKDRLKNAPGFDPDAWPDMSDDTWSNEIHAFYGTQGSDSDSILGGSTGSSTGTGSTQTGMGGSTH
ncbi:MAG: PRC-barrel domain-containing protein [Massilia sp.]